MIRKFFLATIFLISQIQFISAQLPVIERIEPANWWIGFKDQSLQLLVRGNNISKKNVFVNYPGIKLVNVQKVENINYLFINLEISSSTKTGTFPILFKENGKKDVEFNYELKKMMTIIRKRSHNDVHLEGCSVSLNKTPIKFLSIFFVGRSCYFVGLNF